MCEEVVLSSEGDIGFPEEEEALNDTDEALENAIRDTREEALRVFPDKFERFARESLGRQFSSREIETLKDALVRAIGALDPNALPADDPVPCPSREESITERAKRVR